MKTIVLTNVKSHRNKRALPEVREIITQSKDKIQGYEIEDMTCLPDILQQVARQKPDILCINGGDGTIQAIVTALHNLPYFSKIPVLCILSGGRTNMLAHDIGSLDMPQKTLARLVHLLDSTQPDIEGKLHHKVMMKMSHEGAGSKPIFGMFLGTAAIYRAILLSKKNVHPLKLETNFVSGMTLLLLFLKRIFTTFSKTEQEDSLFQGTNISVQFSDGKRDSGEHLFSLVTTLDRLILKSKPYWGKGSGHLRYTRVSHPAKKLCFYAIPLMFAKDKAKYLPVSTYFSRNDNKISLSMKHPFTLDGELFTPLPNTPVVVEETSPLAFLKI